MGLDLRWLKDKEQIQMLERGYLEKNETPEQRYQTICDSIQRYSTKLATTEESKEYVKDIGKRFEDYISKGWTSFSTPIIRSFGSEFNLPISCNHTMLEDSMDGIYRRLYETGILASQGSGTAVNISKLRSIGTPIASGGDANSILDWIELYADMITKTAQNSQRRGFITFYLDADHPEIMDFLDIGTERIPKDKQRFLTTITTAVVLPTGFRKALKEGDKEKRKIFTKILNTRKEAGFPYILDEENSNIGLCQSYQDKNIKINNANICIEAIEYADHEKTFACCLSSIVVYHWDEIKKDPNFLFDMNIALDCVIEEYIEKGRKIRGIESAIKFAEEHRTIGIGISAFHSYLQKKDIAFGSLPSFSVNNDIFSTMREEGDRASKWMATHFGEPKMLEGYGERNTSRMAQAPKKSTSFIDGGVTMAYSEGIEPHKINYGEKAVSKVQVEWKNRELEALLISKEKDIEEVWDSILAYGGSVQHLDFLSTHEKEVFKIFHEISQVDVINLAAQRQKHIDMGQSLNLAIHPEAEAKDVIKLHLDAFDKGIKSLYYQYNLNAAQQFSQELLTCSFCEG
tara:strand:+ start:4965 stop:6683 length:1719 start_codon:yes stop_codon:yes gene_type:complete